MRRPIPRFARSHAAAIERERVKQCERDEKLRDAEYESGIDPRVARALAGAFESEPCKNCGLPFNQHNNGEPNSKGCRSFKDPDFKAL